MHVSYLSCDHEASVLNKWKNSTYTGEDSVFSGVNGYEYIRSHLGYRFVVTDSDVTFSGLFSSRIQVGFTLENRGFSPCYRPFETVLTARREDGKFYRFPVSFDTRTLDSKQEKTLSVMLKRSDLPKGNYVLSLKMTDIATDTAISFANTSAQKEDGVPLGTLSIS